MKVHELITALQAFPEDYEVHLDINVEQVEGHDRYVAQVAAVRRQDGWAAVALDQGAHV